MVQTICSLASSLCIACDYFFTSQAVHRNDMVFFTPTASPPRSNPTNLLNPTIVFYF